ncbi:MAG: D-hexose-6-phosphate mutarotase [Verrucomicrobiota bacterium]
MNRIENPDGREWYHFSHDSGANLQISRFAGHPVSWKTPDGGERLYLSPLADFSATNAIRGGVPIIFPQFSDHGPFGRHGFARKSFWEMDPETGQFLLNASPSTREEWPHEFTLRLSFALHAEALELNLEVKNPGDTPLEFHAAFHTYLKVNDVTQCSVSGLENVPFFDEASKTLHETEPAAISFGTEIDRAYLRAGDRVVTLHESERPKIIVETIGFNDVVVWNPGPRHGISDLPEEGWQHFVCIESAETTELLLLDPGELWTGTQRLKVISEI